LWDKVDLKLDPRSIFISCRCNMNSQRTYYRRNLPHYQPPYATYHIVFRLDGSLPRHMIEELRNGREKEKEMIASIKDEKRKRDEWRAHHQAYFEKFDALMDGNTAGPRWLADDRVAEIVAKAIHFRDAREYDLLVHTIMPNHVHMVCTVGRSGTPSPEEENRAVGRNAIPTYRILQSLKRHTARKANTLLSRLGPFWQEESYDHVIRDGEELERTIWYVLFNPVKASLVETWDQWKWTYVKPRLVS